ncbi:MAG: hypothetical protein HN879_09740, partial [Flavobacteriaceae bacterium]|nr:hypothetical protein [Flavobacteriaceae bacterium]
MRARSVTPLSTLSNAIVRRIDSWPAPVQCAFWIILSGALITVQLAIVRMIANDVNVFEIIFIRAAFGLIFIVPLLIRGGGIYL